MTRPIPTALLLLCIALGGGASAAAPADDAATRAPPDPKGGINALLDSMKSSGDQFLQPDQAFRFDAIAAGTDRVRLNWEIADGYYLYRARIKVTTPSAQAQLGALEMPVGQFKTDEYFGKQEVYHHELIATVPVARAGGPAFELPLRMREANQSCSATPCAPGGPPALVPVKPAEPPLSAATPAGRVTVALLVIGG